jgi:hypothetical protein
MSDSQAIIDAQKAAGAITHGQLGPTGSAPLVPTGYTIKHGVRVQLVTGCAWIGGTGVGTGMGYQLGGTGIATGFAAQEIYLRVDNPRKIGVHATQGIIRWTAT